MKMYVIIDPAGRELSECVSLASARAACQQHLIGDGEEGPLVIFGPDGPLHTATLNNCGRVEYTNSPMPRGQ